MHDAVNLLKKGKKSLLKQETGTRIFEDQTVENVTIVQAPWHSEHVWRASPRSLHQPQRHIGA
jgi:hypothetical protein